MGRCVCVPYGSLCVYPTGETLLCVPYGSLCVYPTGHSVCTLWVTLCVPYGSLCVPTGHSVYLRVTMCVLLHTLLCTVPIYYMPSIADISINISCLWVICMFSINLSEASMLCVS